MTEKITQPNLFNVNEKKRKKKQSISNTSKNTIAFCVTSDEYCSYRNIYTSLGMTQGELVKIAFERMMKIIYENGVKFFMEDK